MEERVAYNIMTLVAQPNYISVPFPDGRLAFRLDTVCGILELQDRGKKYYFDLREYFMQTIDKNG